MEDEIPVGYTRVTECLKAYSPFNNMDPNSSFARNVTAAAERGKRVHKFCEAHALGLFVEDCDADCKNYVDGFKAWFDQMVIGLMFTEIRINNAQYKLSGAIDMVCTLKGDKYPSIIDFKTPANVGGTWSLQTAAYRILLREEHKIDAHRRICLMLPRREEGIKVIEFPDHDKEEALFLKALELHRYFNR